MVSPIRAKAISGKGVLRREDFNDQQLRALYERISTDKDIDSFFKHLAESRQQIPKRIRDRVHGFGKPG